MNPYESPALNVDRARYDRTLFWRIVKCSLVLMAIFFTIDFGWWTIFSLRQESLAEWGPTKFFFNLSWDELRDVLRI